MTRELSQVGDSEGQGDLWLKLELSVVAHACDPAALRKWRQEEEASLYHIEYQSKKEKKKKKGGVVA